MNGQDYNNNAHNLQYGAAGSNMNHYTKKHSLWIIILLVVIIGLLCSCGIGGFLISTLKSREPIDKEQIRLIMTNDIGFTPYEENSDTYMSFNKDDYSAEVQVLDFQSIEAAKSNFEVYTDIYGYEDASVKGKFSGENFDKSYWTTDTSNYCIYRVDEIILWVYCEDKDLFDEIEDKLDL